MATHTHVTDAVWELPHELWQHIEPMVMRAGKPRSALPNGERSSGVLVVKDPYYILARSPLADEQRLILKHGDTFGVFDHYGDVKPGGLGEEGLYHEGTRFLSCLILKLGQDRPLMLSSTVKDDNALLAVDLTNPDLHRSKFLWQGSCYERLLLRNYGPSPVHARFSLHAEADFADIFEVRGTRREQRGEYLPAVTDNGALLLSYRGLDGVLRRTRLQVSPAPKAITESELHFEVVLPPQEEATFLLTLSCETTAPAAPLPSYETAQSLAAAGFQATRGQCCDIYTSNERFNDWLNRSLADLRMMITETPQGPYPYAGVPWFSTPFGRDGILTALEMLWAYPDLARGVLAYLAANQAQEVNPAQDAEPGKILHETRRGEMADLGEIPFGRYYGSVDATPLFLVLAGAYFERTRDSAFIQSLWPALERALAWIDQYGDRDGDGFVEYFRNSPTGLVHQGWKDSHDAVFHADGSLALGPIALCEVQGYVYAAKRAMADMAAALGRADLAVRLEVQANTLRQQFEQAFWCEELSTYALALDRDKRPCRVRTSNAGQCLFTGIVSEERARRIASVLLREDSFSGWGIRTVATTEARYNPMSYHNGSIWPHDNALIALGLARYQLTDAVSKVLTGLFDASMFVDLHRMPELFCGFPRRPAEGPTLYPVACAPQSWAAAAVFSLLQACLGLSIQGSPPRVSFSYPLLPESLQEIRIRNLRVGDGCLDLQIQRHARDVGINVLRREGHLEVVAVK
jgi:glycogen debranching enzyme